MKARLVLSASALALLIGCSAPEKPSASNENKGDEAPAAKSVKDEPIVVSDGSVRLLFRTAAHDLRALSPMYGCCLVTPAVKGNKELRVYQAPTEGGALKLAKTVTLGETDVVQFFFDRKGDGGWRPFDKDKLPNPQLILFRRDFSRAAAIDDAEFADFAATGRAGWIVTSDVVTPKPLAEISPLGKSLGMKREYTVGGNILRLGRLVVKRPDNSAESVTLGDACSAVEFCTAPNCLAGMNSPCNVPKAADAENKE